MNPFFSLSSLYVRALCVLALIAATSAQAEPWRATSNMAQTRIYHTMTVLADGRVLIAGGESSVVEIYDPATRTWTSAGNLLPNRGLHTATLLRDGRVLVVGGTTSLPWDPNFAPFADAQIYDPGNGQWTAAGSLPTGRASHTATLLPDGRVMVLGGFSGDGAATPTTGLRLTSTEIYDPSTGQWNSSGPMSLPRASHTATVLADGTVLAAGGVKENHVDRRVAERFNPASGTWTSAGIMMDYRYYHSATRLVDGRVMVVGGYVEGSSSRTELYDPATDQWSAAGALAGGSRYDHTATLLPDGRVLLTGGYSGAFISQALLFDPVANSWSPTASMTTARAAHTAALLPNGRVLVAGGAISNVAEARTAELYDPTEGSWTAGATLATARTRHSLNLLPDGKLLAAGGVDAANAMITTAERFDPVSNQWSAAGTLAARRADHVGVLLGNGQVLLAGGSAIGGEPVASAERYSPALNTWSSTGSMSAARQLHSLSLLADGSVLAAGGVGVGGNRVLTAERYQPGTGVWSPAGDLSNWRVGHTSVLLRTGQLMICGGYVGLSANTRTGTCDRYLPGSNNWQPGQSLSSARDQLSLTLLQDGRVLASGGLDVGGAPLASAQVIDPATPGTNIWVNAGSMSTPRSSHGAVLLPDGRVLVTGGIGAGGGALASAEIFDPANGEWINTANMETARYGHRSQLLADGSVLIVGGRNAAGNVFGTVERYDPGRAPLPQRQPLLTAVSATLSGVDALTATGSGFRPTLEAGGSNTVSAAANHPVFQVQRIDNGDSHYLRWSPTLAPSNTAFTASSNALAGFAGGPVLIRTWVNGIPSAARYSVFDGDRLFRDGFEQATPTP